MNELEKKLESKLENRLAAILVILCIAYLIISPDEDKIINFPSLIFWIVDIPVAIIALYLLYKAGAITWLKSGSEFQKKYAVVFYIIIGTFFAFLVTELLLIPVKHHIISETYKNPEFVEYVNLTKVSHGKRSGISFDYKGYSNKFNTNNELVEGISDENMHEYQLVLHMKEGLYGCYVIQNWELQKK